MRFNRLIGLFFALVLLANPAQSRPAPAASAAFASPAAVTAWNEIAMREIVTVGQQGPGPTYVLAAYTQAAVYDAAVAIQGGYQPYKLSLASRPGASIDAAVTVAAHDVLVHYFPSRQAALDADRDVWLSGVPDGSAKSDGMAVGAEAAAGIIALRQNDGFGANIGFTMPAPAPGVWQLPQGVAPVTPWLSKLRPFMLESPDQFRPGPPPELTSAEWAAEFNETKTYGAANSPVRTAEQTDIARFWSTHPAMQYNIGMRKVVADRGFDALRAARLLAMGNMVTADASIACFDAKYHYLFWRPFSAVPQAGADGNPATGPDAGWQALLTAPAHPEYPAAHGCATTAVAEVFAYAIGGNQIDVDLVSATPNLIHPSRHYARVVDLVQEIIDARVWGGIHYRESVVKGTILGRKVAQWSLNRYFLPVN